MKNKYLSDERLSLWLFLNVVIVYALVYMTKNCFSAAMVHLVEEGVLTKSRTGTISAVFYIIYAPFQIIGGFAADKYSPVKLISIGLVGAAIVNFLILFNTNYYFMIAAWGINGAIQFGIWPSVFKIASAMLSPVHRKKAMFYSFMSSSIGLILSYMLAGAVSGWRANFIAAAVILLVCSVYWILSGSFLSKKMTEEAVCEYGNLRRVADTGEVRLLPLLVKSGMLLILPVAVFQSVLSLGVQTLTPSMITENYDNVSASMASIITIIPLIVSMTGKIGMDYIYKAMHHTECSVITVCFFILIPLFACLLMIGKASVVTVVLLISVCLLISNGISLVIVTFATARFISFGKNGTLSGIINCMLSMGIVIANLFSTRIADNFGWNAVIISWIIFAAVSAVLGIAAYFPWKKFVKSLG